MKYKVTINNKVYEVEIEEMTSEESLAVNQDKELKNEKSPMENQENVEGILAPIQGKCLKIAAREGDTIKRGDLICIIEAMKLENEIISDRDGVVDRIHIKENDIVNLDDMILSFRK